jgi:Na+/H+ antiporter NhaD/arsenite permease-like protein
VLFPIVSGIWVALAVFLFTYFLISIRRLPRIKLDRPIAALVGAVLMLVLGVVTPERALESIDLDILLLLLGMMLLVVGLELCGLFEWVSIRMIRYSGTQFRLLLLVMVVSAVLSALVLNDAVVLMFTPIVIKACRLVKTDPVPFLVGEVVAANIGSVATAVGNPQNAYIATKAGIGFLEFSAALLPVAVVSLLIGVALIYLVFRKDIEKGDAAVLRSLALENGWSRLRNSILAGDSQAKEGMVNLRKRRRALQAILLITIIAVLGFSLSSFIGISLSMVAFAAGVAAFLVLLLMTDVRSGEVLRKVDWSIILFFVGLFIVLQGVRDSGLLTEIQALFPGFGPGETSTLGSLTLFSAVLSNLVSNVPAVMLLGEMIPIQSTDLWLALASSSTLAGNATLLGAAANIIVAEKAESMGVEVSFMRFVKAGLPIAILTLLVSTLLLLVIL